MCLVTQLCLTLFNPMDCSPPDSSVHGESPGKNTGVGCHAFLQGNFLTQGSNLHLLYGEGLNHSGLGGKRATGVWPVISFLLSLHLLPLLLLIPSTLTAAPGPNSSPVFLHSNSPLSPKPSYQLTKPGAGSVLGWGHFLLLQSVQPNKGLSHRCIHVFK